MRKTIVSFIFALFCSQAHAEENELLGVWSGNASAAQAIYGEITITKEFISWGGPKNPNNAYCRTSYSVVAKYTSKTYPGNTNSPKPGTTFTIYKLKLVPNDCTREHGYFIFALPSYGIIYHEDEIYRYAEVIPYTKDDRSIGQLNFSKTEKIGER